MKCHPCWWNDALTKYQVEVDKNDKFMKWHADKNESRHDGKLLKHQVDKITSWWNHK